MKYMVKMQCVIILKKKDLWTNLSKSYVNPNPDFSSWVWHSDRKIWRHDTTNCFNSNNQEHPHGDKDGDWKDVGGLWWHKYTGYYKSKTTGQNPCPPKELAWNTMSPRDWTTVINSILLMIHDKHFCENFSKEIVDLQWALQIVGNVSCIEVCPACTRGDCNCKCRRCNRVVGQCSCMNMKRQKLVVCHDTTQIEVPDSPDNPNHWGHLSWQFCKFMESME